MNLRFASIFLLIKRLQQVNNNQNSINDKMKIHLYFLFVKKTNYNILNIKWYFNEEEGIDIFFKDKHLLKVSSILVTEEGIDTLINFLHPRKHPPPIDETEEGIIIFSYEEHSKKSQKKEFLSLSKMSIQRINYFQFSQSKKELRSFLMKSIH